MILWSCRNFATIQVAPCIFLIEKTLVFNDIISITVNSSVTIRGRLRVYFYFDGGE